MEKTYLKDFHLYRANSKGDGQAASLQNAIDDKESLFLTFAKQQGTPDANGNATFGWKDKETAITVKLGENDIGEMLACLLGMKDYAGPLKNGAPAGLFHQNPNGSASINLKFTPGNEKFPENKFELSVSQKVGDGPVKKGLVYMSLGDAAKMRLLLEASIHRLYQW